MTRTAPLAVAVAIAALSLLQACDNTSPLSPRALTVIVVAEPATTEVGGVSMVTVSAFDPGGNPAAGVPVVFEASLGSLREPELLLNDAGQASTLFDAGAETGTAIVTATTTLEGQPASGSTKIEIVEAEARESRALRGRWRYDTAAIGIPARIRSRPGSGSAGAAVVR